MRSWIPFAALVVAGWFGGGVALAQPSKTARKVQDDLGLFSAEAETKANAEIARIKQTFHKDLMVETVHPPKQPAGLDFNDTAAVDKFIDNFANDRFKNEQINGVHVLLIEQNKLKKIRVGVGPETLKEGYFTIANRDELIHKIQEKMKAGDKDGALLASTSYVGETMRRNHPASAKATTPANPPGNEPVVHHQNNPVEPSPIFTWILIGLGVLLVFWLVSAIIRGFSAMGGGGGGYGYGGGYGGGGGGGFMSGLLGGMFGAAAGMWMYNHFLGGGTPSAWGGGGSTGGNVGGPAAGEPTDVGAGDPAIGGADYGDAGGDAGGGGGGDWGGGGGDAGGGGGGGDWGGGGGDAGGGGDWGGGGGDAGGGGGDFGGGGGGGGDW